MAGGVGVLPQKAPDDLKPAQKLFELLGVARPIWSEKASRAALSRSFILRGSTSGGTVTSKIAASITGLM